MWIADILGADLGSSQAFLGTAPQPAWAGGGGLLASVARSRAPCETAGPGAPRPGPGSSESAPLPGSQRHTELREQSEKQPGVRSPTTLVTESSRMERPKPTRRKPEGRTAGARGRGRRQACLLPLILSRAGAGGGGHRTEHTGLAHEGERKHERPHCRPAALGDRRRQEPWGLDQEKDERRHSQRQRAGPDRVEGRARGGVEGGLGRGQRQSRQGQVWTGSLEVSAGPRS